MRIKSNIKAGGSNFNHNETLLRQQPKRSPKVKTHLKAVLSSVVALTLATQGFAAQNGIYVWTNETGTPQDRANLITACTAPSHRLDVVLLNGYDNSRGTLFPTADLRAFNQAAHQAGLVVYALFTDKNWIATLVQYNDQCTSPDERFDGYAMDFEGPWPSGGSAPSTAADIQYYADAKTACGALPLHVSIGWHWDNIISYRSQSKPAYQHILDLVDSMDVQTVFETAAQIVFRSKEEVSYATLLNKPVFPTIETQDLTGFSGWGVSLFEWNTFFEEGEVAMWTELAKVSFAPDTSTGFMLHYYKHAQSSGTSLWPLVPADNTPPTIMCPAAITKGTDAGNCSATVDPGTATATDDRPGVTVAGVRGDGLPLTGPYPNGVTTIRWTATDTASNTASCDQTITVNDTESPVIPCPANITVNAAPGACSSNVTFSVTATDNCAVTNVVSVPASGFAFPVGVTTVTSTARDSSGNSAQCTFTVTVNDTQPPVITCPANITVSTAPGTCTSNVTFSVTATDNCAVTNVVSVPASGFAFPVGVTTVTSTARDSSGNSSQCTFTVTVNDTQPPVITCPANITVSAAPGTCSSNVAFSVTATDNCAVTNVVSVPASGLAFPVGVTTVTSTARDSSGNSSQCTFTVTVNDTQPPVPNVSPLPTVTGQGSATVTPPRATDACDGLITGTTPDPLTYSAPGTYTVHWTYTDTHGNKSTQTQTVSVQAKGKK